MNLRYEVLVQIDSIEEAESLLLMLADLMTEIGKVGDSPDGYVNSLIALYTLPDVDSKELVHSIVDRNPLTIVLPSMTKNHEVGTPKEEFDGDWEPPSILH